MRLNGMYTLFMFYIVALYISIVFYILSTDIYLKKSVNDKTDD